MIDSEPIIQRMFEEECERLHEAWTWEDHTVPNRKSIVPMAAEAVANRVAFLTPERVREIARNHASG